MITAGYGPLLCRVHDGRPYPYSKQKRPLFASRGVQLWVDRRPQKSPYIRGLTRGCIGCRDVHDEACRVLLNLLWKLGLRRISG